MGVNIKALGYIHHHMGYASLQVLRDEKDNT
jgi:hypothetical protein